MVIEANMAQVAVILNDQLVPPDHPERQALLASAYRARTRPICGCKDPGLPLYVSKVDDGTFWLSECRLPVPSTIRTVTVTNFHQNYRAGAHLAKKRLKKIRTEA